MKDKKKIMTQKRDRKLNSHRFKAPRNVSTQRSASYARKVKELDAKSVNYKAMLTKCADTHACVTKPMFLGSRLLCTGYFYLLYI